MRKMLPVGMYVVVALVCQIFTIAVCLVVEQMGFKWGSVTLFGILYLVMFAVAWKLTVLIMDGVLIPKGLFTVERTT